MPCDPRIRVINHPCTTRGAARNIGVEHARGEVIAFLDVDCVWYDHHIQTLLEPFCVSRRRKLGWAYATADEVGRDGSMLVPNYLGGLPGNHPKTSLIDCLSADINVLPSAALVSRQAYLAVGGCDERLATLEDDDLFVRLFQAGYDNAYIHEPLSAWCQQSSLCCEAAEIAASRRLYLHRLLEQFPDEPRHGRYFARDLIAPRFFRAMLTDARKAILSGNLVEQREAVANLGFVTRRLAWRKRLPLQTLLLPLLNFRPIARLIMQSRIAAFRLYRMFVRA